jgi:hypothetical protein
VDGAIQGIPVVKYPIVTVAGINHLKLGYEIVFPISFTLFYGAGHCNTHGYILKCGDRDLLQYLKGS